MKTLTAKQQTIVKASFALVSKKGIKGLTTKALAQSLGVTEPSLYRHFKNKSEILFAILCRMEEDNRRMRDAFAHKELPALEKLEAMYVATMGIIAKSPVLATVMFSEEQYQENRSLCLKALDIQNNTLEMIRHITAEGFTKNQMRSDIPKEAIALAVMGMMRLLVSRWRLGGYSEDLVGQVKKSWRALKILLKPYPAQVTPKAR